MEELGIYFEKESQEQNTKMKRDAGNSWNPFPELLGPIWNFFGAESKQDHDRFQEKLSENLEVLKLQDKKLAGSLKRISKQMAVGLRNVEYNIQQIANATGLVKQTNRVESHIEHIVVSIEVALETFVEIRTRADSNLVSRNVMTRQDLLQMNVKSNDIYHSLRPLFSNSDVDNYFKIPIATTAYWPKDEKFVTYLLKESKNNEEMEKNIQARTTATIVGSSSLGLFGIGFIVCCIYAIVNCKK